MQIGQAVYIQSGGYYQVASGSSIPTFYLQNLGYAGNIPVGSTIASGTVSPAGLIGATGSTGPTGPAGATGVGINAYSAQFGFSQPATGANIAVQIPSGFWMQINQVVYIPSGGYYQVASGAVPTFYLTNLGYNGNIPVGSKVASYAISPAGIAGTTGVAGTQGATGIMGINSYSTNIGFSQPAVGTQVAVQVPSGYWMQVGQVVYIPSGGYYQVASGAVPTFYLTNLGYQPNIPVGSTVATASIVPAGIQGPQGQYVPVFQAAHGFLTGDPVYWNGSAYALAEANNANTLGIGIASVIDANDFNLYQAGYLGGVSGFSGGQYYFVSDTTAGLLTPIEPTNTTSYSNPIFYAITATGGFVLPFRPSKITVAAVGGSITGTINNALVVQIDESSTPNQFGASGFLINMGATESVLGSINRRQFIRSITISKRQVVRDLFPFSLQQCQPE